MTLRHRRSCLSLLRQYFGLLGSAALMVSAASGSAEAQPANKEQPRLGRVVDDIVMGLRRACPPGYRVPFQIGALSLFIDPIWIRSLRERQSLPEGTCPVEPFSVNRIRFYSPDIPSVRRMFIDRRLPHLLELSYVSLSHGDPLLRNLPTSPETRREIPELGYVEDITSKFDRKRLGGPTTRRYLLQERLPTGKKPLRPSMMQCAGPKGSRTCQSRYLHTSEMLVEYRFDADHAWGGSWRWSTPNGQIDEPEGFLRFHQGVHDFVDELLRLRR